MASNLIKNGAFDLNPASDLFTSNQQGTPDNWARAFTGATGGSGGAALITPWFDPSARWQSNFDTTQELLMQDPVGTSFATAGGGWTGILQNVPASPGLTYCFSLHAMVLFAAGAGSMKLQLVMNFRSAANASLSTVSYTLTPDNYSDARNVIMRPDGLDYSNFRRPYVVGTSPAGTASVNCWILLINDTGAAIVGTTTWAYLAMAMLEDEGNTTPSPWERNMEDTFGGHEWPAVQPEYGINESQLVKPYQYKFKNILMGTDTPFLVESVEGLLSAAPVRDSDIDRTADHGSVAGVQLLSKRTITLNIRVLGEKLIYGDPDDIQTRLEQLRAAFQPNRIRGSLTPVPFYFWHRNQVRKFINVRCTRREIISDYTTNRGPAIVVVELQAADPMIYSVFDKKAALVIPASNTSKVINLNQFAEFPVDGDQVDGAAPVVEIFGPATNPVMGSQTENRYLRFQIVLAAGHSLRINTKTKKVEKNIGAGYVEDYSIVRSDNQWFRLLPGITNTLSFSRTDSPATTAKAVVSWRDVWQ